MFTKLNEWIQAWWLGLSDRTRGHVISATKVFIASFAVALVALMNSKGGITFDSAFWLAVFTTGFNNAIKALVEQYAPKSLGGIRKLE